MQHKFQFLTFVFFDVHCADSFDLKYKFPTNKLFEIRDVITDFCFDTLQCRLLITFSGRFRISPDKLN